FCSHGPECLEALVNAGHYEAAISVLSHVTPLFFSQPEELISDDNFMKSVQKLLVADQTYMSMAKNLISPEFPGRILKLIAAMIIHHMRRFSGNKMEYGSSGISLWVQVFTGVPEWVHNRSALYILDIICSQAFHHIKLWHCINDAFAELMKGKSASSSTGTGTLSSLYSWLTSGTTAPNSLMVRSSAPEFPWFTAAVLQLETQHEITSGLWKNLLIEFHKNPDTTVEAALKKVCDDLVLGPVNSNLLSIYRWGQQVIDLHVGHPALPITLHCFFMMHLARTPPVSGNYDCGSVTQKFYEGYVNGAFLGKIKTKVLQATEYYEELLPQEPHGQQNAHNTQ
ncbi:unnamed protein product, partial [Meganyctiphanes norvegica]